MVAKLSDSIPDSECFTIEDIAEEFGLSTIRTRQVLEKAVKGKYVQNMVKVNGRRILYTPHMVEQLKAAKEKGVLGKFNKSRKEGKRALDKAQMVVKVPIFDSEIAKLLVKKFQDEEKIGRYLQTHLEKSVKPFLSRKQELLDEYERKLQDLMNSSELSI